MKIFDFGAVIILLAIFGFAGVQYAKTEKGAKAVTKIEAKVKPHLEGVKITEPYINPNN